MGTVGKLQAMAATGASTIRVNQTRWRILWCWRLAWGWSETA